DVSAASGACRPLASWVALANDFDGDGRLDLFVGNDAFVYPQEHNALFARDGADARGVPLFVDRASYAIGEDSPFTMGAALRDVDGDGVPDLYLTSIGGNPLFLGDAGGPAREVSRALGVDAANIRVPATDAATTTSVVDVPGRISWGAGFLDLD